MRRAARIAVLVGPWLAVGFALWRQQSLEAAVADFTSAANRAIEVAIETFSQQLQDAADAVIARGGSAN